MRRAVLSGLVLALAAVQPVAAADRVTFGGSFTIRMSVPADRALHLYDPVGERAWAPDWSPQFMRDADAASLPEGTVFTTRGHGDRPSVWVLQRYDRTAHEIAYTTYVPDTAVVTIRIAVHDRPAGASEADVRYDLTSVSDEGDVFVRGFGEKFSHMQPHWQQAIDGALARTSGG